MADLKISQLPVFTSAVPATDAFAVVSGGTTKQITTNQILGSGGTATLASATITGDLTVDTSTLKVDSTNDNVGIGTTTPTSYAFNDPVKLVIANTGTAGAGNTFTIASGSAGFGQIAFANGTSGTDRYNGYIKYSHSTNAMEFYANAGALQATLNSTGLGVGGVPSGANRFLIFNGATQALTLDTSGNLLVGTTTTSGNAGGLKLSNVAGNRGEITFSNNSGSADYVARFNYGSTPTLVGNITVSSGGTSFVTTSDYRLKELVAPLSGGLARVNALKPSVYNWKSDGSSGEGFLAHELAEVVPLAVTGEKDAVNADGSIKPQGVDLSKVVPVLVAAIQELAAEVNALKKA